MPSEDDSSLMVEWVMKGDSLFLHRVLGTNRVHFSEDIKNMHIQRVPQIHTLTGNEIDSMTTCEASTPAAVAMEVTRAFSMVESYESMPRGRDQSQAWRYVLTTCHEPSNTRRLRISAHGIECSPTNQMPMIERGLSSFTIGKFAIWCSPSATDSFWYSALPESEMAMRATSSGGDGSGGGGGSSGSSGKVGRGGGGGSGGNGSIATHVHLACDSAACAV